MRPLAALVALAVLVPAWSVALPAAPDGAWRAKADAPLLEALDRGAHEVVVVVQGPPLAAPDAQLQDRAAWRAHWAASAEPFLGALRARVAALGGEVRLEVAPIDAAFLVLPAARVPELLAWSSVQRAGLDAPGMVQLAPDSGPSVAISTEEAVAHLHAQDVWALGFRGEGAKVAVVDTGIKDSHEVFRDAGGASRVVAWHDATDDPCATPCDLHGHGTRTAHLAAGGAHANPDAPEGAAPSADIVGVRIFKMGSGTWEDAQEGLQAAFDLGAEVAANPWGGGCTGGGITTAELAEALADAGMGSVFPAGSSQPIGCPASAAKVVTTGSTGEDEVVASNSARGPCAWKNASRTCPDVMAVGLDIDAASIACDTCYNRQSGSSWTAAQVAGVVALLEQASLAEQGEDLSPAKADTVLRLSARDLGPEGPDDDYGWGMADALAARDALGGGEPGDVRPSISVSQPVLHRGQSATLALAFTNMGSVPVVGHVLHDVDQVSFGPCPPACEHVDIADADVTLGTLEEFTSRAAFAADDHSPGTYHVDGDATFRWTDPVTGQEASRSFDLGRLFEVKKVVWQKVRTVPPEVLAGSLRRVELGLANVGNEDASALAYTERFAPTGFAPLPQVPPSEPTFEGLFATPAPDAVDLGTSRVTYRWVVGDVDAGQAWVARYDTLAALPGDYVFRGTLEYKDETGRSFLDSFEQAAAVTLP